MELKLMKTKVKVMSSLIKLDRRKTHTSGALAGSTNWKKNFFETLLILSIDLCPVCDIYQTGWDIISPSLLNCSENCLKFSRWQVIFSPCCEQTTLDILVSILQSNCCKYKFFSSTGVSSSDENMQCNAIIRWPVVLYHIPWHNSLLALKVVVAKV